jgi:predicted nucleic acid-binding protein
MTGYLVDTNHLSAAVNPVSPLRERIYQAHQAGVKLGTCVPVLCELEVGIQQSGRTDSFRRQLRQLLKRVRLWPLDLEVARLYGEIFHDLRHRGRVLSQVDMMLAALAKLKNLTLLTADQDFAALPEICTENWVS